MKDYDISPKTKGYVQVYTGDGKGKTTAAFGLAMRAVGAGLKVYIGQFIKEMEYGEVNVISERFPEITVELFGTQDGCIYGRKINESDRIMACKGFDRVREVIASGEYDIVILDEISLIFLFKLIPEDELIDLIRNKPDKVELIITGREVTERVIAEADLVTEMKEIKHYYNEGVLSRKGIEC